jgi:hypothetical protein
VSRSPSLKTTFENAVVQQTDAQRVIKDLIEERRELSARLTEMKRERWQTTSQSSMQELDRRCSLGN